MKRILLILLLCAFKVHDGDTFTMDDGTVVRLYGVDAPEMENPYTHCKEQFCTDGNGDIYRCANESRIYLENLLRNKQIVCVSRGTSYNRMVGDCKVDGFSVSNAMIISGMAVEDRRYSSGQFTKLEMIAKVNHIGFWSGHFEMPWDYRRNCK